MHVYSWCHRFYSTMPCYNQSYNLLALLPVLAVSLYFIWSAYNFVPTPLIFRHHVLVMNGAIMPALYLQFRVISLSHFLSHLTYFILINRFILYLRMTLWFWLQTLDLHYFFPDDLDVCIFYQFFRPAFFWITHFFLRAYGFQKIFLFLIYLFAHLQQCSIYIWIFLICIPFLFILFIINLLCYGRFDHFHFLYPRNCNPLLHCPCYHISMKLRSLPFFATYWSIRHQNSA